MQEDGLVFAPKANQYQSQQLKQWNKNAALKPFNDSVLKEVTSTLNDKIKTQSIEEVGEINKKKSHKNIKYYLQNQDIKCTNTKQGLVVQAEKEKSEVINRNPL